MGSHFKWVYSFSGNACIFSQLLALTNPYKMTISWLLLCCVLDQIEDDVSMFSAKKTMHFEVLKKVLCSARTPTSSFSRPQEWNVFLEFSCGTLLVYLYNVSPYHISAFYFILLIFEWGRGAVVVSALDVRSEGRWYDAQSLPSHCFLGQTFLPHTDSVHSGV